MDNYYETSPTVSAIGLLTPTLESSSLPQTFSSSLFPVLQDHPAEDDWKRYIDVDKFESDDEHEVGTSQSNVEASQNDFWALYPLLDQCQDIDTTSSSGDSSQSEPSLFYPGLEFVQGESSSSGLPSASSSVSPRSARAEHAESATLLVSERQLKAIQPGGVQGQQEFDELQYYNPDEGAERRRNEGDGDAICSPSSSCDDAADVPIRAGRPTRRLRKRQNLHSPATRDDGLVCPIDGCGARVGNATDLKRHLNTVHAEKARCVVCKKPLVARKDAIDRHLRETEKCLELQIAWPDDSLPDKGVHTREDSKALLAALLGRKKRKKATEYQGERKRRRTSTA